MLLDYKTTIFVGSRLSTASIINTD